MYDPIPVPIQCGKISSHVTHHLGARVDEGPEPLSFDTLETEVCAQFGITKEEMHHGGRMDHVVWPRQVAMYCCMRLLGYSSSRTGIKYARDHGTVLAAAKRVEWALECEPHNPRTRKAAAVIETLRARLPSAKPTA